MNAMANTGGPWIAAIALALILIAAVCAALLWRRSERRQARLIGRLRQDAAQPFCRASMTYLDSEYSSTVQGSFSACSARMTAVSSMRLLVVFCSPPESSFSCPIYSRMAPQPPGPGLPEHAPSV